VRWLCASDGLTAVISNTAQLMPLSNSTEHVCRHVDAITRMPSAATTTAVAAFAVRVVAMLMDSAHNV